MLLHRDIFGAIYPWTGEFRTVEIAKGSTRLAAAQHLERKATKLAVILQADCDAHI